LEDTFNWSLKHPTHSDTLIDFWPIIQVSTYRTNENFIYILKQSEESEIFKADASKFDQAFAVRETGPC
jgi:hypothetical protein